SSIRQRGSDVHDRTALARQHPPQGGHRAVNVTEIVHFGDPLELLRADLAELGEHGGDGDIDSHIERTEGPSPRYRRGPQGPVIGERGLDGHRRPTRRFELVTRSLQALLTAGEQGHFRAGCAEGRSARPSDPPACTGDDDDLAVELVLHASLPKLLRYPSLHPGEGFEKGVAARRLSAHRADEPYERLLRKVSSTIPLRE